MLKSNCNCIKKKGSYLKAKCLNVMRQVVNDDQLYNFLATQIRYTMQEKSMFLSFYSASPKYYKLLKKIITLPSVRTLQKMLQNLNFKPGFHNVTLNALATKVKTMSSHENLCVLLMDEISLKRPSILTTIMTE